MVPYYSYYSYTHTPQQKKVEPGRNSLLLLSIT